MHRIEMLDQHEPHASIGGKRAKQILKRFESAGRGADTNDRKRCLFRWCRVYSRFWRVRVSRARVLRHYQSSLLSGSFFHANLVAWPVSSPANETPLIDTDRDKAIIRTMNGAPNWCERTQVVHAGIENEHGDRAGR